MKILAMSKLLPHVSMEDIGALAKPEAAQAWELYATDVIREMYFRTDVPGAVLILECDDVDQAHKVLSSLPMVEHKLIDFDVIPLGHFLPLTALFAEAPEPR